MDSTWLYINYCFLFMVSLRGFSSIINTVIDTGYRLILCFRYSGAFGLKSFQCRSCFKCHSKKQN